MNWRDLLYFSSGERRALTFLLSFILVAFILLVLTDHFTIEPEEIPDGIASGPLPESKEDRIPSSLTGEENPVAVKRMVTPVPKKKHFAKYPPTSYPRANKLKPGEKVELNTADTTLLKKVPGIGSAFARRIVGYRTLLGGFYTVDQLREVYGMDKERFRQIYPFFRIDTGHIRPFRINGLSPDTLIKHPYFSYQQQRVIHRKLRLQGSLSGWEELVLLEEFSSQDLERLTYYVSFE
ncbi:MAG: helix-hairpin-helix domain-containing protein [Tannerellaceae bacterium]|nr:helix-hairpin-helix domain-containing protein [Tannerellaceae bacterium]